MEKARDSQYQHLPYRLSEIDHSYGPNVHILSSPVLMTGLAKVCAKETTQPEANRLFTELYIDLLKLAANAEFPRKVVDVPSRMIEYTERGYYLGETLDPDVKVAVAAVARAGNLPSQVVFDRLNLLLNPGGVRLDSFFVGRTTNAECQVTGADVSCAKIGGPLDDRILLIPDPMGATGSSVVQTLNSYPAGDIAKAQKIITLHLIVTPEYLMKLRDCPHNVEVYAIRLDRGLSSPEILATKPGTHWKQERGLTDIQYIVPGGGGIGEVMTNSWV